MFDPFSIPVEDRVVLATDLFMSCAISLLESGLSFQEVSGWLTGEAEDLYQFLMLDAPVIVAAEDVDTARERYLTAMRESREAAGLGIPTGEITIERL